MSRPKVYLAGAIRDGVQDDIDWREAAIEKLSPHAYILNPLAGKVYNAKTKKWTMNGVASAARTIVKQDFWCVDRADIVVFNFRALSEGYPMIGSLIEFGRATARGALIYSIIEKGYTGHGNTSMYRLHPFLEENSCVVFNSVEECLSFMSKHVAMLSGENPHYAEVVQ